MILVELCAKRLTHAVDVSPTRRAGMGNLLQLIKKDGRAQEADFFLDFESGHAFSTRSG